MLNELFIVQIFFFKSVSFNRDCVYVRVWCYYRFDNLFNICFCFFLVDWCVKADLHFFSLNDLIFDVFNFIEISFQKSSFYFLKNIENNDIKNRFCWFNNNKHQRVNKIIIEKKKIQNALIHDAGAHHHRLTPNTD